MLSFLGLPSDGPLCPDLVQKQIASYDQKVREAVITALALTIIAIIFAIVGGSLQAAAFAPPEITLGMELVTGMSSKVFLILSGAVFSGVIVHGILCGVHQLQKTAWQGHLCST